MKIYTKTGDKGTTSLLGGTRVSKSDAKLEAYGTVDELNSNIGLILAHDSTYSTFLTVVQNKLFNMGSLLAMEKEVSFEMPTIDEEDIIAIENEIDRLNESLEALSNFILPQGNAASAQAHISRCVCRRAERRVVTLQDENYTTVVQYLNRLSDYLFVLSRELLRLDNKKEVIWSKD